MNAKILIADDDEPVRKTVARVFAARPHEFDVLSASDGPQALALAESEHPDLILLDVGMPGKDGWDVLYELRRAPGTSCTPVIIVSGRADAACRIGGIDMGADDYLTKPFCLEELLSRARRLLARVRRDVAANPLTRLPGSPGIEEAVSRRISENRPFALFYADIDRFKAYNDRYGFAQGDHVILETAKLLADALLVESTNGFLGHIGGDDFVLMTNPQEAPHAAQRAVTLFDEAVRDFYPPVAYARGFIETKGRDGVWRKAPLIRLSIGIATSEQRTLEHYAEAVQIVSEMKSHLKSMPDRGLSRFAFDRRTER